MQRKFLILEDNIDQLNMLKQLIQEMDASILVYATSNIDEAYRIAVEHVVDGFFVDIVLNASVKGDASGIRFVKSIREIPKYITTPVIFITSLEDPGYYAYRELKCFDYLEKPFDPKRLKQNIDKIKQIPIAMDVDKVMPFQKDGILYPIPCDEIRYICSKNHLLNVFLEDGTKFEAQYRPMKQILEELDSGDFFQCSKGTIVNRRYVYNVDIVNRFLTIKGLQEKISIGITYKSMVKELFYGT